MFGYTSKAYNPPDNKKRNFGVVLLGAVTKAEDGKPRMFRREVARVRSGVAERSYKSELA